MVTERALGFRKIRWTSFGLDLIAGVDEVGRGCLAGPVYAAAVIVRPDARLRGVTDSKLIPIEKRLELAEQIKKCLSNRPTDKNRSNEWPVRSAIHFHRLLCPERFEKIPCLKLRKGFLLYPRSFTLLVSRAKEFS